MRVPTNGLKIVTFGLNIPVKTGRVVPYETVETRGQILWRAAGVGAQLVLKTKLSERITVRLSCFPPFLLACSLTGKIIGFEPIG